MIRYVGVDPSTASPAMAILDDSGKLVTYRVRNDTEFDTLLVEMRDAGCDIRISIERPPLANTRLASAHYQANYYKKRFMELVPRTEIQFVYPVTWQSRMLSAGPKMLRDQRKRLSVIRAMSFGFDPEGVAGADDVADAINIADYSRIYLVWGVKKKRGAKK